MELHDKYNYAISTIIQKIKVYDKYTYTKSLKSHNYIYGINDGKSLANGIRRLKVREVLLYLIAFNFTTNLTLHSGCLICTTKSPLIILTLPNYNHFCQIVIYIARFLDHNYHFQITICITRLFSLINHYF